VSGTTGWFDRLPEVENAVRSAGTGLIYAPNFSLGVQLFFRLAQFAGRMADGLDEYDVHVSESHHRHKLDHPSGTAEKLAAILLEELGGKQRWELGTGVGAIDPAVLQVTSVRAGEIPGEHAVALEGPDDRVEVRHESRGRTGLARGAVTAAEWVHGRKGIFTLDDMLADKWS
jgi:4-hydroxy-tetrahydrodipicolinate reductase